MTHNGHRILEQPQLSILEKAGNEEEEKSDTELKDVHTDLPRYSQKVKKLQQFSLQCRDLGMLNVTSHTKMFMKVRQNPECILCAEKPD